MPLLTPPFPEGVQLRLFLDEETLPQWLLPYILERDINYGLQPRKYPETVAISGDEQQSVVIEYSSPNIASEFHGKHLRSTLLGAQLANLYKAAGWKVTKLNYLGDWGKPIGLLGAGFERYGSQEALREDPVTHLHEIYLKTFEEFLPEQKESRKARDEHGDDAAREVESAGLFAERNAFFKRMEDGDPAALDFARSFRDFSVKDYASLYARLGVNFDEYSGESEMTSTEATTEVMRILEDKCLIEESGGALTINLKNHGSKHGIAIIRDRDGSGTYLLRDLVAVLQRHRQHNFDKMIYLVAADSNKMHFMKLFKILELMGFKEIAEKLQHVSFNDNTQIAKEADHEQSLREFLDRAEVAMDKATKEEPGVLSLKRLSAGHLCTAALFAHVASSKNTQSMVFDAGKLANVSSGSGADLLAWYEALSHPDEDASRLDSLVIEDTQAERDATLDDTKDYKAAAQQITEARSTLLRLLARFPEIVDAALHAFEPAAIMVYLGSIAACLRICVPNRNRIRSDNKAHEQLLHAAKIVLRNALELLGMITRYTHPHAEDFGDANEFQGGHQRLRRVRLTSKLTYM